MDEGAGQSFACVATVHAFVHFLIVCIWNWRHIPLMHSPSSLQSSPKALVGIGEEPQATRANIKAAKKIFMVA
jgi:hypothetical protein